MDKLGSWICYLTYGYKPKTDRCYIASFTSGPKIECSGGNPPDMQDFGPLLFVEREVAKDKNINRLMGSARWSLWLVKSLEGKIFQIWDKEIWKEALDKPFKGMYLG